MGNLSVGGTGKTPMVLYLLEYFQKKYPEKNLVVLSRGYKAKLSSLGALVPDNPDPKLYGDEPSLIKSKFPKTWIVIGVNRYQNFQKFVPEKIRNSSDTIVILDDGFQHIQISRDLDIVLLDSNSPFGNGFTIPLGVLREPISHLIRADVVIFTKQNETNQNKVEFTKKIISKYIKNQFTSQISFQTIEADPTASYLLITGVGNPRDVLYTAKQVLNSEFMELRSYPDHYEFNEENLASILEIYFNDPNKKMGIITTEKDWIKISHCINFLKSLEIRGSSIHVIKIGVRIEDEARFSKSLDHLVSTSEVKTDP